VRGLLSLPRLRTLVMGNMQPVVQAAGGPRDFLYLQRLLRARAVRLTSEELAYELQTKEVGLAGFVWAATNWFACLELLGLFWLTHGDGTRPCASIVGAGV
jgi:hypothetical protein